MEKRNYNIDILKTIGLFGIILAHVCTNQIIMQLRGFDVTMLVLLSGYLSVQSLKKIKYIEYVKKRFNRLILPTWIFLTLIFAGGGVITLLFHINYPFTFRQIFRSYILIDGIGYVWIIRVYFLCALITPILINLNNKLDKKHIYILISAIIAFHEILAHFHIYSLNPFFNYILSYLIGYGIVTFIGIMLNDMSHIEKKRTSIIFLGIYLTLATIYFYIDGAYRFTGTMKYPPHLYFISYALAISFFLITLLDKLKLNRISIITFISSSTLWIYLWHIPFIYIMNLFFNQNHWIINYIVVVILSVIIVYIQNKIIKILETKNVNNKILKIFKG